MTTSQAGPDTTRVPAAEDVAPVVAPTGSGPDTPVVVAVPVTALVSADSPRLGGEDVHHVYALAESGARLPPIVVHRATMRVIDGMHRLRAAVLRAQQTIEVQFFDGTADDAFVLAVRSNVAHGLPLSRADRTAAALRIIASHPAWSDRSIAAVAGLSHKTVAAIRRRAAGEIPQSPTRIGRDGRSRPLDNSGQRRLAGEIIANNPGASLRQVARTSGLSPATVRDVRARLSRGDDAVLPRQRGAPPSGEAPDSPADTPPAEPGGDHAAILRRLSRDPSVRHVAAGRQLLRLLETPLRGQAVQRRLADAVPPHCVHMVVLLARRCAGWWLDFAEGLERRDRGD